MLRAWPSLIPSFILRIEVEALGFGDPAEAFHEMLMAELGGERFHFVAELGVEKAAALIFSNPAHRMILAHRLATTGLEVIADRDVAGFVDSQQYLHAGQPGDRFVVVRPVGGVVKLRAIAFH